MVLFLKKIFILVLLVSTPSFFFAQTDSLTVESGEQTEVNKKKGFLKSLFSKKDKDKDQIEEDDEEAEADTSGTKKRFCLFNRKKNDNDSTSSDSSGVAKKEEDKNKLVKPKKEFKPLPFGEIKAMGPDERIEYYKKKRKFDDQDRAYRNNKIRKKYAKKEQRVRKKYELTNSDKQLLNKGKRGRLSKIEQLQFNKATQKASIMAKELRKIKKKRSEAIKKSTNKIRKKNKKESDKWYAKELKRKQKEKENSEGGEEGEGNNNSETEENE